MAGMISDKSEAQGNGRLIQIDETVLVMPVLPMDEFFPVPTADELAGIARS